jgi:hypothetical protein
MCGVNLTAAPRTPTVAGRVEDLLVHFEDSPLPRESLDAGARHGAHERGNIREPGFRGGRPPDRD